MPNFITYNVTYTNVKPWKGFATGTGTIKLSIPEGTKSVKAKLKRMVERQINSLGVRIESFETIED